MFRKCAGVITRLLIVIEGSGFESLVFCLFRVYVSQLSSVTPHAGTLIGLEIGHCLPVIVGCLCDGRSAPGDYFLYRFSTLRALAEYRLAVCLENLKDLSALLTGPVGIESLVFVNRHGQNLGPISRGAILRRKNPFCKGLFGFLSQGEYLSKFPMLIFYIGRMNYTGCLTFVKASSPQGSPFRVDFEKLP